MPVIGCSGDNSKEHKLSFACGNNKNSLTSDETKSLQWSQDRAPNGMGTTIVTTVQSYKTRVLPLGDIAVSTVHVDEFHKRNHPGAEIFDFLRRLKHGEEVESAPVWVA